jgi:hypothetical protein
MGVSIRGERTRAALLCRPSAHGCRYLGSGRLAAAAQIAEAEQAEAEEGERLRLGDLGGRRRIVLLLRLVDDVLDQASSSRLLPCFAGFRQSKGAPNSSLEQVEDCARAVRPGAGTSSLCSQRWYS